MTPYPESAYVRLDKYYGSISTNTYIQYTKTDLSIGNPK